MQESPFLPFRNEYPETGIIRILPIPSSEEIGKNWVYHSFIEKDRTWDEWVTYIRELDTPIMLSQSSGFLFSQVPDVIPPYIPNTIPDPWFHRAEAANIIRSALLKTMRIRKYAYKWLHRMKERKQHIHEMRWILRKCIARMRERVMQNRIHGQDHDIVTMEEIPPELRISVYDTKSRSLYYFNAYTIHGLIQKDLLYQSFAIADPLQPKNPYTNISWSQGQLITLIDQIQLIFLRRHKFICDWIIKFRNAQYSITKFYKDNYRPLQIYAAKTLFSDKTGAEFAAIMEESLNDLFDAMNFQTASLTYIFLKSRSLPNRFMDEWDDLLCTYWIYENHQVILHDQIIAFDDLVRYTRLLFKRTENWIRNVRMARAS